MEHRFQPPQVHEIDPRIRANLYMLNIETYRLVPDNRKQEYIQVMNNLLEVEKAYNEAQDRRHQFFRSIDFE